MSTSARLWQVYEEAQLPVAVGVLVSQGSAGAAVPPSLLGSHAAGGGSSSYSSSSEAAARQESAADLLEMFKSSPSVTAQQQLLV